MEEDQTPGLRTTSQTIGIHVTRLIGIFISKRRMFLISSFHYHPRVSSFSFSLLFIFPELAALIWASVYNSLRSSCEVKSEHPS